MNKSEMITTPMRLLLVENDPFDIKCTREAIGKIIQDPEISLTHDMEGVRNNMINYVPDVVISNYNLPECTGLDVLEMVRNFDPEVPFIFLTGSIEDDRLAAETILTGASGFILKKHRNILDQKLRPLLKKAVLNITTGEHLRERLRENRIVVNQIYEYLNNLRGENVTEQANIDRIRENFSQFRQR